MDCEKRMTFSGPWGSLGRFAIAIAMIALRIRIRNYSQFFFECSKPHQLVLGLTSPNGSIYINI